MSDLYKAAIEIAEGEALKRKAQREFLLSQLHEATGGKQMIMTITDKGMRELEKLTLEQRQLKYFKEIQEKRKNLIRL